MPIFEKLRPENKTAARDCDFSEGDGSRRHVGLRIAASRVDEGEFQYPIGMSAKQRYGVHLGHYRTSRRRVVLSSRNCVTFARAATVDVLGLVGSDVVLRGAEVSSQMPRGGAVCRDVVGANRFFLRAAFGSSKLAEKPIRPSGGDRNRGGVPTLGWLIAGSGQELQRLDFSQFARFYWGRRRPRRKQCDSSFDEAPTD